MISFNTSGLVAMCEVLMVYLQCIFWRYVVVPSE